MRSNLIFRMCFNCTRKKASAYNNHMEQCIKYTKRILDKIEPGWRRECKYKAYWFWDETDYPLATYKKIAGMSLKELLVLIEKSPIY